MEDSIGLTVNEEEMIVGSQKESTLIQIDMSQEATVIDVKRKE
jgi:hypothetical protein